MVNRRETQQGALRGISGFFVHINLPLLKLLDPILLIPSFITIQAVEQLGVLLGHKVSHVISGIFAIELGWCRLIG